MSITSISISCSVGDKDGILDISLLPDYEERNKFISISIIPDGIYLILNYEDFKKVISTLEAEVK
jgi:hypothetical protein